MLLRPATLQSCVDWSQNQPQALEGKLQVFPVTSDYGWELGRGEKEEEEEEEEQEDHRTQSFRRVCKHTPHSELTMARPGTAMLASLREGNSGLREGDPDKP